MQNSPGGWQDCADGGGGWTVKSGSRWREQEFSSGFATADYTVVFLRHVDSFRLVLGGKERACS